MIKILNKIKGYAAILAFVVVAASVITNYAQAPEKIEDLVKEVEAVKEEVAEGKDNVQRVAATLDKYMAVQHEQNIAQEKREALLIEWLKESKDE